MVKSTAKTIHFEGDVPDEHAGALMRYITNLKGTIACQPNGTVRGKNDKPSKMNDGKADETILAIVSHGGAKVSLSYIKEKFAEAGFRPSGAGSVLTSLVRHKVIRRLGQGSYTAVKALPSPKKEK